MVLAKDILVHKVYYASKFIFDKEKVEPESKKCNLWSTTNVHTLKHFKPLDKEISFGIKVTISI